ncbi:MAG: acyltransferase, partial [Scytonema sp. PMC 1069.18]|nr:acyltransferase [Scytonema sp. PMC 1069.18]
IEIGDRVWLTRQVMVLKGAIIGHDVVIGPRSIITKNIPPNTLAIGIPAKVVRTGITWLIESI